MAEGLNPPSSLPTPFPLAFGRERRMQLVELAEADYRAASFLDERLLANTMRHRWAEWPEVRGMAAGLVERSHFIFHIGHVGSTLLSRLIGEHPGLFSLREPAILRTLAQDQEGDPLAVAGEEVEETRSVCLRLLSRSWRADQTAVVKATSFVSEIADDLLARTTDARALLLFATPLAYLRGILGGPASRAEAHAMAASRLARLNRRLDSGDRPLESLSEGERIAASWLAEMAGLHAAARRHPDRILWINFDQFLADPAAGLASAFAHLRVHASTADVLKVLGGPIMRSYSKAPEHAYDRELRARVLMEAEAEHGAEIRRGMDWLGRAASASPPARDLLETAARVRLAAARTSRPQGAGAP